MKRLVAVALCGALLLSGLLSLLPGLTATPALAADREVVVATTYPSVTTGKGKEVTFPIDVINKGTTDEWLKLEIVSSPENWAPTLKASGFVVREVFVAAGETQSLTLAMTPPADVANGDYAIVVKATSKDGAINSQLNLNVGISSDVTTGLKLSTDYPKLNGSLGGTFSFKLTLTNQSAEDRTVALSAVTPEGWVTTFKPAYDSTEISSLRVKAGADQGIDVTVRGSSADAPGTYPITVIATAGGDKAEVELSVNLTGSGELTLMSASGRYNAEANAGSDSVTSMILQNTGAAALENITFAASAPEGWTVTFDPAKIADLQAGATQQVNVHIAPSAKAIAGDYIVNLTASSGATSESREIRMTVTTSGVWGFAGILVVAIVVVGMVGLYTRLGRR